MAGASFVSSRGACSLPLYLWLYPPLESPAFSQAGRTKKWLFQQCFVLVRLTVSQESQCALAPGEAGGEGKARATPASPWHLSPQTPLLLPHFYLSHTSWLTDWALPPEAAATPLLPAGQERRMLQTRHLDREEDLLGQQPLPMPFSP